LYDGCTATVDDRIGRLYKYLETKGILDDTIFIVTSDHGDVRDEHPPHVEHHLCAYDELIRVPLIMRYPKVLPKGKRVRWITQTLDILPTILDILDVSNEMLQKTLQGYSVLPAIDNEPCREFALTEYMKPLQQFFLIWRRHPDFDIGTYNYMLKALRTLEYKYIWYSNGKAELFDLNNDPSEKENLAKDMPDKVLEMKTKMENFLMSMDRVDYGDWLNVGRRIVRMPGAEEVFRRLKTWGLYRETKQAQTPQEKDTYI
jgi:arylsulfatase A-like enzyme